VIALGERAQDALVVEYIGIHQQHVTAAGQCFRGRVHREDAAELPVRIEYDLGVHPQLKAIELGFDLLGLETESEHDLRDARRV